MSTPDTPELLRAYVNQGSDAAFRELVSRYVDLVYSTALRRVNGNPHFAEEVVQSVFTDLARKAATLPGNVMLGGWLHRHTSNLAANFMRAERRRTAREQEAYAMNQLHDSTAADWSLVAPFLDEAIDLLEAADRDAIVLRYLEQRDLRSVGLALGVTEDTAQKRVSRAVEKLRSLLVERGASLTVAVLATSLATEAVSAAPAALADRTSRAALAGKAAAAGFAALLLGFFAGTKGGLAAAAAVLTLLVWTLLPGSSPTEAPSAKTLSQNSSNLGPTRSPDIANAATANTPSEATAPLTANGGRLRLTILNAENNRPIRNTPVEMRAIVAGIYTNFTLRADRAGICDVAVAPDTSSLELITRLEGFADRRLAWRPDRGFAIPSACTMRLARPVPVGGRVLDPEGRPLAEADVAFHLAPDPILQAEPEGHNYLSLHTKTAADGTWHLERIGADMLPRSRLSASHTNFVEGPSFILNQKPASEQALREGTHVTLLKAGLTVTGFVVDEIGRPVSGARVTAGPRESTGRRMSLTDTNGHFAIRGCAPGNEPLTAEASGFATTTVTAVLAPGTEPFRLVLGRGKLVRLRVVDPQGKAVPNARATLSSVINSSIPERSTAVQTKFTGFTDAEGRVTWESAPDSELNFFVAADGHMRVRDIKVRPQAGEQVITLPPALVVSGTVRHALTGEPIPKFRIISGTPGRTTNEPTVWIPYVQGWFEFANGRFHHVFQDPVVQGMANPKILLKFEAEGFATQVSRVITADESDARFDIQLRPETGMAVTVLRPDGNPAAKADIALVTPGADIRLQPGQISRRDPRSGKSLLITDARGQFILPADPSLKQVIAMSPDGFAEGTLVALAATPTLRLEPYGAVEGIYLTGGKPAAGRKIYFEYGRKEMNTINTDRQAFGVITDNQGRFKIENALPGRHTLVRAVPLRLPFIGTNGPPANSTYRLVPAAEVTVEPGKTTTVTLGATENTVTFHASLPEGITVGPHLTTVAKMWTARRQNYEFAEADGLFVAEGISPGAYDLDIRVMDTSGGQRRNVASARVPVVISQEQSACTVDLGNIVLQKITPNPPP
jgi:RNA polymerase sigma factor (sigma-70 family)